MMKRYLAIILVGLAGLPAFGQEMADYYQLPDRHSQFDRLLTRYGGAYTRDRWYVALNGFVRADRARLDNSFGGLIESERVTKFGWSALIGWTYREKWAVEGGYANSPIHTKILVNNGRYAAPLVFRYANEKQGLVLRGKRLIASTSGPWRRSGFWLTGGLWLIPNNGQRKGEFALAGYSYSNRVGEKIDTLRLTSQTTTNKQPTALAEAGVEYNVRLSNRLDMGVSVRKFWGLGSSVTSDLTYIVNGRETQQAQLRGTGNGMSIGLSLRYTYAIRRTLPNVLDIQGKRRIHE